MGSQVSYRHFVVTGREDGGEDHTQYVKTQGDGVKAEEIFKDWLDDHYGGPVVEKFISMVIEIPGPPIEIFQYMEIDSDKNPEPLMEKETCPQ